MRDALSLLDRGRSVANDVTVDVGSASAGLMNREYICLINSEYELKI